ncbi:MAG: radical SAM protein [Oscillospiraceae bacterium]|jgi:formate C-acetyltransferase|nr:radical SAM protein [Oscillospiraceae bacterium]
MATSRFVGTALGVADKQTHTLTVAKIQRTCVHDGTGLRSTVFFKGCGLRCLWCQNPENLTTEPRDGDLTLTPAQLVDVLRKDHAYYKATAGGVTLSGGEPLLQNTDTLLALLRLLSDAGIPVNVETTLFVPWSKIEPLIPYIDTFLVDFKVVGDSAEHEKLTGQSDERIRENVAKLLASAHEPKVRFRMVIVPGYNDAPAQIQNAAEYIKSLGFDDLELLQYWKFYEDKAERLGLDVPQLGIAQTDALTALKAAAKTFRESGLEVWSDSLQPKPYHATFTERVNKIRQELWEAPREICFETALLKTEYYKKFKGFKKPVHIHRAERLKYVLEHRTLNVYPGELLVGNFTAKRVAGQIWEEQYGPLYITFLYKAARQTPVPFASTKAERRKFYTKVFPYWLPRCIIGRYALRNGAKQMVQTFSSVAEQTVGFNNNFAAIAHFIVNFDRLLENGTAGLKEEIRAAMAAHPENNQDFYRGALEGLDALEIFGLRYVDMLNDMAATEGDAGRRQELLDMAAVCAQVPKHPARTFREALQAMTFLMIALCTEAYENAVSLGRLDQILQPYYERDLAAGRITYDEAKELLSLFVLKMDECILVNDGDGLLNISKLFETLSTDQAVTFGGLKPDGTDGTNPVTYMLCDICELLPLAINMCARIHKDSPQKYLNRLAQLYIGGCPMPELFSDEAYLKTLATHYRESEENCRNYSIVGCVEPICSPDHFGNTDCCNMNVTLPLVQAMRGTENDLWNYAFPEQVEKFITRITDYAFPKATPRHARIRAKRREKIRQRDIKRGYYSVENPPQSMDELLERYQERLNFLARSILHDQQVVEQQLSETLTTPLASSLYEGCIRTGKDAYEGGTDYKTAGIQAVGITDTADSLVAINELVFKQGKYTLRELLAAIDADYVGEEYQQILADTLACPKFGDNTTEETAFWVNKVMDIYNRALAQCPYAVRSGGRPQTNATEDFADPRSGAYTAGYYALNTSDRYGKYSGALPSGHRKGVSLANSVAPAHGAVQDDLLSALNDVSLVDFARHAVNGSTVTFTIDAALFPGQSGVKNLAEIFRTFLTHGGMQFQPNVVSRELLQDAYDHPEKHKYLMVRVAGYCAYFQELSDELKKIIIGRTCYA